MTGRIVLDRRTRWFPGGVLLGGRPRRVVQLSAAGEAVLAAALTGTPVPGSAAARLTARLIEGGIVHPQPVAGVGSRPDATVLVPVLARDEKALTALDGCLAGLGPAVRILVVDDGSPPVAAAAIAELCRRSGARLVRRESTGGPAAARNSGLAAVDSEWVAFLDSDCLPTAHWLERLLAYGSDPRVVAIAPRVRPLPGRRGALARYLAACSPLDLGPHPALVRPLSPVAYLPTAALLVRRSALAPAPFDEALRHGEDVDLVWRLLAAGGQVRYVPDVVVHHREPVRWGAALHRRYRYGTSAAPLHRRHPGLVAPVVLAPLPALAALLLLARRPALAAGATGVGAGALTRRLHRASVPLPLAARIGGAGAGGSLAATLAGLGHAAGTVGLPLVVLARARRLRWLLVAAHLWAWWDRRPELDPVRFTAAALADGAAYGAGVWASCRQEAHPGALWPVLSPRSSPRRRPRRSPSRPG